MHLARSVAAESAAVVRGEESIQVWDVKFEQIHVSKWAFDNYDERKKADKTLMLYQLTKKKGVFFTKRPLEAVSDAAKGMNSLALLRESKNFALYSETKKQWYILVLEEAENPTQFKISSANVAFGNTLACSGELVQGIDKEFTASVRQVANAK